MPKIRVLVVDDAVVMRRLITDVLSKDDAIEVVGVAANGKIALQKIPQLNPDLVTLDVEMPELNGIETLREIRKIYPKLPVIMFSTLTQRGAVTTLDALQLGANDYVTKPANVGSVAEGMSRLASELVPKIKAHCRHLCPAVAAPAASAILPARRPAPNHRPPAPTRPVPIECVCIGCSTGGPNALAEVFKLFPSSFPVPLLIVQHMPPMFTALLAERLTAGSRVRFTEAQEGDRLQPGCGYIAPGGRHMEVRREGLVTLVRLHDGPPENSCRPAVDVLFRSAASVYGAGTLGVILTGMGQDGLRGCEHLHEKHAPILAQDEPTSVVWGMPGAVTQAGLTDRVLPLSQICGEIVRRVAESRNRIPVPNAVPTPTRPSLCH
ncbi:MAG: chemotaxis response regulator protein-glutamate methylesterase [Verrucomicrobiales bacterium]|nr:chemotaxis response regulator protein-glutamate methylesterase [Verrucomicrobiales bacterium]